MILDYKGLNQINGSLVILEGVENASYEEMVSLHLDDGSERAGRIVRIDGKRVVVQVFAGTRGISMFNTRTRLTGKPMEMSLSPELIGRVFD